MSGNNRQVGKFLHGEGDLPVKGSMFHRVLAFLGFKSRNPGLVIKGLGVNHILTQFLRGCKKIPHVYLVR